MQALAAILSCSPDVDPIDGIATWWTRHRALAALAPTPFDHAVRGGFAADRLGYAFASGYQAALRALVPDLPADRVVSLCVTERKGARPRAIESALTPTGEGVSRLDGEKRWSTLADDGGLFLVAARAGDDVDGRTPIRVARVSSTAPGVTVERLAETPFVPEIPHASLRFEGVVVRDDDLLPGDGYERYVRPFRTVEDLHVNAALLGYLIGEARRNRLPTTWIERLSAGVAALHGLAGSDPSSPAVHVALAGLLQILGALIGELDPVWAASASPAHARWQRDRVLLGVAESARSQRLARAWERLSPHA